MEATDPTGARSHDRGRWLGSLTASLMLTVRALSYDALRFLISLGALAFAVLLVLVLRGIMDGTVAKSTTYIDHAGASVIVAPAGVRNMALALSLLPEATATQLAGVQGVEQSASIIRVQVIVGAGERRRSAVVFGYSPQAGLGGPWKLAAGRGVEQPSEIVVDRVLASNLGVRVGGEVSISGRTFTIVGLSDQTTAIAGKLLFVDLSAAQELFRQQGFVSFVLLRTAPGSEGRVAAGINAVQPSLNAMTRAELSRADRELLGGLFVAPINVMSTIGLLVGLAIVGLTMYIVTSERLHDFGVLKAIGATNGFLLRTVLAQSFMLGVLGFLAGLGATFVAGPVVVRFVPDIGVDVRIQPAAATFAAVASMAALGALLPVARILRVDPLTVFRRP